MESQLLPASGINYFIQYIAPIIQLFIIIGGAGAGLYKYYKTKNREIYQQLLSEVYSPLYQYFVKQELLRKLLNIEGDYHETPVMEFTSKKFESNSKTGSSITSTVPILMLTREEFMKALDSINIGLSPKELYTLLSMYKVLVYFEETADKSSDCYLTSTIMKVDIENRLRREILSGYEKYHKKLGIKAGAENNFFMLSDDQLSFNITVSQEEKNKLSEQIKQHPDLY
jgi:hypothetical protein